jgi:hypothetical protein
MLRAQASMAMRHLHGYVRRRLPLTAPMDLRDQPQETFRMAHMLHRESGDGMPLAAR